jgi:hypothetical protein
MAASVVFRIPRRKRNTYVHTYLEKTAHCFGDPIDCTRGKESGLYARTYLFDNPEWQNSLGVLVIEDEQHRTVEGRIAGAFSEVSALVSLLGVKKFAKYQ